MTDVAALITDMVKAGVSAEIVGRVAAALAEREVVAVPVKDEAAERRREKDREHKRNVRRIPQTSADSADAPFPDKETSPTPPKEINPYPSETNVSGVAAPNVIVLADPRADLFDRGKRTLVALTGKPIDQCGKLIGRWLKAANDDAVKVLRTIEDAARNRVADAVPWIEAALRAPKPEAQTKPDWVLHREKMQRWV